MSSEQKLAQLLADIRRKAGVVRLPSESALSAIRIIEDTLQIGTIVVTKVSRGPKPYKVIAPNLALNPSWDIDLADWIEFISGLSAGTTVFDDTITKFEEGSLGSLRIERTGGADTSGLGRFQDIVATPGEVWSFECLVRVIAISNCNARIRMHWRDSGDAVISEVQSTGITAINSDFALEQSLNQTAPANTVKVRVHARLDATLSDGTGVAFFDQFRSVKRSTIEPWATRIIAGEWVVN